LQHLMVWSSFTPCSGQRSLFFKKKALHGAIRQLRCNEPQTRTERKESSFAGTLMEQHTTQTEGVTHTKELQRVLPER
jgi:hypothetical protein